MNHRLAEARRLERDRLEKQQQRWAEPNITATAAREDGFMSADLPGFAPPVDRTKKPPLLTLAVRSVNRYSAEYFEGSIVASSFRSRRRERWSRAFRPPAH